MMKGIDWADDMHETFDGSNVTSAKRESIYWGNIEDIQIRFWRDTAVMAIFERDDATYGAIVKLFKKDLPQLEDVFGNPDGKYEKVGWYADDAVMMKALEVLKKLVRAKEGERLHWEELELR